MRSRMVSVLALSIIGFGDIPVTPVANARFDDGAALDDNGGPQPLVPLTSTARG